MATGWCAAVTLCGPAVRALEFPGPGAGPAQSSDTNGLLRLENNLMSMTWVVSNSQLYASAFVNKLTTQSWAQVGSELFRLGYGAAGSGHYFGVRLGTNSVDALVSFDGGTWLTLSSFARSNYPGDPAWVQLGKMDKNGTNTDYSTIGSAGECHLDNLRVLDSNSQTLLQDDFAVLSASWTVFKSSQSGTSVSASNGQLVVAAPANCAAYVRQTLPAGAAFLSCAIDKFTDQGQSWSPSLCVRWANGKFILVGYRAIASTFNVISSQAGEQILTRTAPLNVAASDCTLISGPQLRASQPSTSSTRTGDRLPGQELVAAFVHPASGLRVDWRAALRDEANYLRQFLTISGGSTNLQITGVELLDYATGTNVPAQVGTVTGSPAVAGQVFFGGETPFASNTLATNRVAVQRAGYAFAGPRHGLRLLGVSWAFMRPASSAAVSSTTSTASAPCLIGPCCTSTPGWICGRTKPRPPCWRTSMPSTWRCASAAGQALDSYVMDDGWDNPSIGFWAIDTNKFPHRFDLLRDTVVSDGSHLGIWISPLGGYNWQAERIQDAINEGIITSALDLSLPSYYNWWTNKCATFIVSNAMNYFKWDNAGNGVNPHFMALLRAGNALRSYTTNLFINVTVGTWPSPFWLTHVDSTWRGGGDTGSAGVGDAREQWLTYRDGVTWQNVVQPAPLYPLNSIMLHGIIQASGGGSISQAGTDLRHEARSFFGSGLNLQELYLTPSMLTAASWDQLAQAALWARTNAAILIDSHWIGGNPNNLEIYGWASWSPAKGLLVLRNPSTQTNSISLDVGAAFELPPGAATTYDLAPAYPDQRPNLTLAQAGQSALFTLQPLEVVVLEASPHTGLLPPTILQQPSPARALPGGAATLSAGVSGSSPLSLQWYFNGVLIPGATNSNLVLSNLTYDHAGDYFLQASNAVAATNSTSARVTVVTPSPYSAALWSATPIAYWRLDETNGPTVFDLVSGHNGTASGSLTFGVPGALTNDLDAAFHFEAGGSNKVDVSYVPELNAAAFSFELWARVTGGSNTYRSPLTSRDDSPTRGYICYAASNNRWEFWTGTGASGSWHVLSGPAVAFGQWTHLAGTFDGTNKVLYVNGLPAVSATATFAPNQGRPLRIGGGATESAGNYFFTGDVDEVVIYDHALTAAQVQQHYQAAPLLPKVGVEPVGAKVRLTWSTGILYAAGDVRGPWTPVPGVTSPWICSPSNSVQLFRVKIR